MNALGLGVEVRVELANDDPGVGRLLPVKADEMQTIQGEPAILAWAAQRVHVPDP
jgi:hypothetical protein